MHSLYAWRQTICFSPGIEGHVSNEYGSSTSSIINNKMLQAADSAGMETCTYEFGEI